MATIFNTGFEGGSATELDATAGTVAFSTTTVRTGTYSLRTNPTTTGVGSCTLASVGSGGATAAYNKATVYHRFYFRYATIPSANDEEIFRARAGASIKFQLRINSSGNLVAYDSTPTLIATGATALSANTWYRIEVKVPTSASTTDWEVKIDGTSELLGSNYGAVNLLASNHTRCNFGKSTNYNGNTVDFFFDDILLSDSAYPGAGQCVLLYPDADGSTQQWTIGAGAGSHYQVVDEIPHNSDTDYLVSTLVSNDIELVNLISSTTAGIGSSDTINTVRAYLVEKRDGAAGGTVLVRMRCSATNSDNATNFTSTASYDFISQINDVSFVTASAWTTSEIDGLEVGALEKNVTNKTRITFMGAMVDFTPAVGGGSVNSNFLAFM